MASLHEFTEIPLLDRHCGTIPLVPLNLIADTDLCSPMVISTSDLHQEQVQRAVAALRAGHTRPLPDDPRQTKLF